jgi:hypothetical protein
MRIVPLFLILAACPTDTTKPTGETGTYITETDADTDADTDTDTDADTDTDTDTDPTTDTVLVTFDEAVPPVLTPFGGDNASVVVDPTDAGNMVGQIDKTDTAETWAGTTISYCDNFSIAPLPFTKTLTQMSVRVWSPDAGVPVLLKVENSSNGALSVETLTNTTAASTWETLVFDFTNEAVGTPALNLANTYDKVSIFPNFGTTGASAGAKTYYVDDVTFLGAVFPADCIVPKGDLPITFDNPAVTYTLTGFGGAEDAAVEVDPDDAANMVARVIKSGTAELWAGTTFSTLAGEAIPALPLTTTDLQMTVRVRSPRAGIQVRLKVEEAADPTRSVETEATTTAVDTWETLTFDFATPAAGTAAFNAAYVYNQASIFFDFGVTGADGGNGTFYFDDVDMAP